MKSFKDAKRVVIKIGTSTLTHKTGMLDIRHIESLIKVISDLKNSGKEIIVVTSGAIGVGVGKLAMPKKPDDMPTKQACAALGQSELMYVYDKYFSQYNHNVAQILLTRDIIEDEQRKQNVINTLRRLVELKIIPIVNENDTVAVEEIVFGDNDTLSAIVAELVEADMLILLSDIDGLYDKNPHKNDDAKMLTRVNCIDGSILNCADGKSNGLGTGGMDTKLQAAARCMENNIPMYILNGANPNLFYSLMDGEPAGTLFVNE